MNKRDRDYLQAWEQLDPETKAELAAAGINGPDLESKAVFHPEYNADVPVEPNEPFAGIESDEKVCEVVRRIVGELLGQSNPALAIECFSLVTGIGYIGDSMTEIARRHDVTRAAVSKRCIQYADALGLKPSRAMRSRKAEAKYSHRNPDSMHPHLNRIVTVFSRMREAGWLHGSDVTDLKRLRADLEPVRAICMDIEMMINQKESI